MLGRLFSPIGLGTVIIAEALLLLLLWRGFASSFGVWSVPLASVAAYLAAVVIALAVLTARLLYADWRLGRQFRKQLEDLYQQGYFDPPDDDDDGLPVCDEPGTEKRHV